MARVTSASGIGSFPDVERAISDLARQVNAAFDDGLPKYALGALPSAKKAGRLIFVENAAAGKVVCLSDGENWLELQPVGPVS